ncbi:acyl-CoA thioesterase [Dasania marina]|uniref:acyl-CoA thioesterase n=1 Tax=Dasania marina TaxID=471499 RepID=UPI0003808D0F|nr:thioesterase family protein [Dasania marina]|tara:strand:- start:140165 stop:140587 length:423 start_codon:yes stop_codon:yes gene_type:complete
MTNKTFNIKLPVRFADCDPAGIVFFPRYFEMINAVVEEWFASALDWSFTHLIIERNDGVPTVKIECEFSSPSRMGDILDFTLVVHKLGRGSITLVIEAFNNGVPVLKSQNVLVYTSGNNEGKSISIPAPLRERMAEFLTD